MTAKKSEPSEKTANVQKTAPNAAPPVAFWKFCVAKTSKATADGLGAGVYWHCRLAGVVAEALYRRLSPNVQALLPKETVALAAVHDVGKISPGFQRMIFQSFGENAERKIVDYFGAKIGVDAAKKMRDDWKRNGEIYETDHTAIGDAAIRERLKKDGGKKKWAEVVAGHHGKKRQNLNGRKSFCDQFGGAFWRDEREKAIDALLAEFGPFPFDSAPTPEKLTLAVALVTFADWIASDESLFPYTPDFEAARARVEDVLDALQRRLFYPPIDLADGDDSFDWNENVDWSELFQIENFKPNDVQRKTLKAARKPGVYVLEAPMGIGKTEAAEMATFRLAAERKASGFYFALPTRTTSDKIYARTQVFVQKGFKGDNGEIAPPDLRLLHGTAWLKETKKNDADDEKNGKKTSDANSCDNAAWITTIQPNDERKEKNVERSEKRRESLESFWYSRAKRGFLTPFGVGTIDQTLLGVLNVKHYYMRLFGLVDKVVILDEVHSYDAYTGSLIRLLIERLEKLNATVFVLSATLTRERRFELLGLDAPNDENSSASEAYPLLTYRYWDDERTNVRSVAAEPPKEKRYEIETCVKNLDAFAARAVEFAERGEAVLCVLNTVDAAQELYKKISKKSTANVPPERIGLLHSRFTTARRDELEDAFLKMFGKDGNRDSGAILVSTQVVEQSVDIDADVLITELAPSDMILQRLGRLWRHERSDRRGRRKLLILGLPEGDPDAEFDWKTTFGASGFVYEPYVLYRSWKVWKDLTQVTTPTEIRKIVEATYRNDDSDSDRPEIQALLDKLEQRRAKMLAKATTATLTCLPTANDSEADAATRWSDSETATILLLKGAPEIVGAVVRLTLIGDEVVEFNRFASSEKNLETAKALAKNVVSIARRRRDDEFWRAAYERLRGAGTWRSTFDALESYLFGDVVPLICGVGGELTTLDGDETPFAYTKTLGGFRVDASKKDGDDGGANDKPRDDDGFDGETLTDEEAYDGFNW